MSGVAIARSRFFFWCSLPRTAVDRYLACLLPVCWIATWFPAVVCGQTSATTAELDQRNEFFEKRVRPLLIERCQECHAGEEQSGGLRLDSRQGWQQGGDSGPTLVPHNAGDSLLMRAVEYADHDLQMPPDGRLPEKEIAILRQWIETGAHDPREADASVRKQSTAMSVKEGREFWSFQPLNDPHPPPLPQELLDRAANPIDNFVLQRLLEAGLEPAEEADRRALIRRLTFDLTGLPPTPSEVQSFLTDTSPTAYSRVVERLLGSPRYGERWGRHWLDVARYADSNGLDENLAFGNAWRYRDYVVRSFNEDLPFDEFLVQQLAGDLLPRATQQTRTATGFLALGAKVLAEPDRMKLTMDTIDEQIDTTGKAFMGLTLGCSRCHDHKFDPILQRDYYALAAIFKSTRTFANTNTGAIKHWYEHSFATAQERERIQAVDAEISAAHSAASKFKSEAMASIRATAVAQAAEYLAAATQLSPLDSLNTVAQVAAPQQLHPRILHHLRRHLEFNQDDPLVAEWHRLVTEHAPQDPGPRVREHFRRLFANEPSGDSPQTGTTESSATEANAATAAVESEAGGESTKVDIAVGPEQNAVLRELRQRAQEALQDRAGLICVPPQPEFAFSPDTLEEYYQLLEEARLLESSAPDEPAAMGVADGEVASSLPIHIRGSHRNLGAPVAREFPVALRRSTVRPIFPENQSGRLELARWLTTNNHPLTARVYVNRIWGWHFGQALVRSTENFGVLGDPPSHPDLLDYLARQFVRSGWSTKALHRMIVHSQTYRMATYHADAEQAANIDPENRWLWRFPRQRLQAEQLRDALLSISGQLDERMVGKSVPLRNRQFVFNHTSVDHTKYDSRRRAVYLPVIRNNLYPFFAQFDFPDPTMPTGHRMETTVAPQALLMMNDGLVIDCAARLAGHLLSGYASPTSRIDRAYRLILNRPPSNAELGRVLAFLKPDSVVSSASSEHEHWTLFCQGLFACNEFMYLP